MCYVMHVLYADMLYLFGLYVSLFVLLCMFMYLALCLWHYVFVCVICFVCFVCFLVSIVLQVYVFGA